MKEEFKNFVRKKPELIKYVNNGSMTWQKFYEQWNLYGEDDKYWSEYTTKESTNNKETKKEESFNFSSIGDMIKKLDMDQVQKGVNSLQKIVELLQGFTLGAGDKSVSDTGYKPRQLFKKFED